MAIKLKPDNATSYYNRGNAYYAKNKYKYAIADYDQAIKLKPDYVLAYYSRGNIYASRGDYNRAIADYNQIIQFKSDHAGAYNNRGNAYFSEGNYELAIADYNKATNLDLATLVLTTTVDLPLNTKVIKTRPSPTSKKFSNRRMIP